MKKLMNLFLLSCKKAAALIDKGAVIKLSTKERVMLRMHTKVCDACAAYQKQSRIIDSILDAHLDHSDEANVPLEVNDELKKKIITRL